MSRRHQWRHTTREQPGYGMHDVCVVCGIYRRSPNGGAARRFGTYYLTPSELAEQKGGPRKAPPCVPGRYQDQIRVTNPTNAPITAHVVLGSPDGFEHGIPVRVVSAKLEDRFGRVVDASNVQGAGPWYWKCCGNEFELAHHGKTWRIFPLEGVASLADPGRVAFGIKINGFPLLHAPGGKVAHRVFLTLGDAMREAEIDAYHRAGR